MSERNQLEETKDCNIVAAFVVQFDVLKGNIIEWQYPPEFDLEGIEYQAICSGLHNVDSDILYFCRKDLYYGISVFKNAPTHSARGAKMKAIGVLVKPTKETGACGEIWKHKEYLTREINRHMIEDRNMDKYGNLIGYYEQHKLQERELRSLRTSWLSDKSLLCVSDHSVNYNLINNRSMLLATNLELIQPNDFVDLLELLGEDIFVLWKASILRKRIMFIDDLRLGNSCGYVHCTHLMGHIPDRYKTVQPIIPKFTVGVNDISEFEKSRSGSFVACTPDSIFQTKTNLYDTTVSFTPKDCSKIPKAGEYSLLNSFEKSFKIESTSASVRSTANAADKNRYRILLKLLQDQSSSQEFVPQLIKPQSFSPITDFYYWLYEEDTGEEFKKRPLSHQSSCQLSRSSSRRESGMLGGPQERYSDEEDAMEINPNDISQVVAARASGEINRINSNYLRQKYQPSNITLINFFQNLTYFLLLTLQDIISENEESDIAIVYPKDMVKLGLDPTKDIEFVTELSQTYFGKQIRVHYSPGLGTCFSACCLTKKDESYIRI
ncbi:hypothetical protein BY458DRAFT_516347 [Sporodiniella umbellata]|nr:hypothetical protein BY458DRAFT_516347 [Sporodiniella umbellata]